MNINEIHREITPLTEWECFLVFDRKRKKFDFPIHFHPEFELNLIVEFLNDMRLGFAARWLLETDMKVAEIAFKCGFNNPGYFNRVFKKAKGCTPIEFKENFIGIKKFS